MKCLFLLWIVSFSLQALAAKSWICTRPQIDSIITKAKAHSGFDKDIHCSVSCGMTLKCSSSVVFGIGVLKEVKDVFGPGNAEWADLRADRLGISLATSKRAKNLRECFEQCDLYYPN